MCILFKSSDAVHLYLKVKFGPCTDAQQLRVPNSHQLGLFIEETWSAHQLVLKGKGISTVRANSYTYCETAKHKQSAARSSSQGSGFLRYPQVLVLSLDFVLI